MPIQDKTKIEKLLKTYSTKDISKTFIGIDERLVSLHECSANDFSQLNRDFKNLFNQLKIISENISDITLYFKKDESILIFEKLKTFANELYASLINYKKQSQAKNEFIAKTSDKLGLLFFPIKNTLQNLSLLKYLLTNLNILMPSNISEKKETQLAEKEINLIAEKIGVKLNQLNTIITKSYELTEADINNLGVILLEIIHRIDLLERKYQLNKNCFINLKSRENETEDNISNIIKKLQYHDIIRQKMEHIQKTHQDLIDELNMFNHESNDEKSLVEKAKFYLKIRDISGIQAAQLIQANKEYQSAIETIVNNFVSVLTSIDDLKNTCKEDEINKTHFNINVFSEISSRIDHAEKLYHREIKKFFSWEKELNNVEEDIFSAVKYIKLLDEYVDDLKNTVSVYLSGMEESLSDDENIQKAIAQIKNVTHELEHNSKMLSEVTDSLENTKVDFNEIKQLSKDVLSTIDFNNIKNYVASLKGNREVIENKLTQNRTIGDSSLNQIKKSISEIKYYEYFESVVEEITKELNAINQELKKNKELNEESLSDNLNILKEYYTVETEYSIHEKMQKGENTEVENNEDGEIEFF